MKIIDAKGELCPKPLILTKKGLKSLMQGEQMIVLMDNEISKNNVERFLKENNAKFKCVEENGIFKLTITKLEEGFVNSEVYISCKPHAESYCEVKQENVKTGNHIFVFKTDGVANDELGQMLTQGIINTIPEIEPLPNKIVFYHEGVKLALEDSPILQGLQKLEKLGVELLICGNCVDFYNVRDKVKVGIISNAYTIIKAQTEAGHLIYP